MKNNRLDLVPRPRKVSLKFSFIRGIYIRILDWLQNHPLFQDQSEAPLQELWSDFLQRLLSTTDHDGKLQESSEGVRALLYRATNKWKLNAAILKDLMSHLVSNSGYFC